MGCDWSKSAASFEDLHDAPYSLLSVSVEEGGRAQLKSGRRGSKKRDKRKARDAAKGNDSGPVVPKSSGHVSDDGAHKSTLPSLNLPDRSESANRRDDDLGRAPNKGSNVPVLGAGLKPALGFKLDISKAISQGREPTERQLRKEKLDRYENECTKVEEFMYVGGIRVAQNMQLLKAVGITHVINCSAITTDNFFPDTFSYKALYMNDSPGEDLACHIYSVVAVIDEVRRKGQKVLVHCTQGVSRSCSFCIAYLMLLDNISYDDGFQRLKARRGICNPNPGFCSQLVMWGRRLTESKGAQKPLVYPPRIFRVDYYYPANKKAGAAPMLVDRKGSTQPYGMQSTATYIIDSPECVYVWAGAQASKGHRSVADFTVESLQTYEGSPMQVERCEEGHESERMVAMLKQLNCLVPSKCALQQGVLPEDAAGDQAHLALADDSAYLAEKAQRRAEEREADARRVEERERAAREREAAEVRRVAEQQQQQQEEAAAAARRVGAHAAAAAVADGGGGGGGAAAGKGAFPQGGLAEEVCGAVGAGRAGQGGRRGGRGRGRGRGRWGLSMGKGGGGYVEGGLEGPGCFARRLVRRARAQHEPRACAT
jgi:protein-tyrosine phosphatase